MFSALVRSRPLPRAASLVQARQMGGTVKVHACDQEALVGASEVARTEAVVEMGVRYEAGVPTPAEGTNSIEPIPDRGRGRRHDGLVARPPCRPQSGCDSIVG